MMTEECNRRKRTRRLQAKGGVSRVVGRLGCEQGGGVVWFGGGGRSESVIEDLPTC